MSRHDGARHRLGHDNGGAGVGTATWSCDHTYVLTEQVFVNAMDTLTIEPGTAILGMEGSGRSEFTAPTGNEDVGYVLSASYDVYPGALVVARGGFLSAEGTSECPIQCSFLGDPLDGSVGLDVQGRWGGIVMCGGAAINTLYLEGIDLPFLTGGIGTGRIVRKALWMPAVRTDMCMGAMWRLKFRPVS